MTNASSEPRFRFFFTVAELGACSSMSASPLTLPLTGLGDDCTTTVADASAVLSTRRAIISNSSYAASRLFMVFRRFWGF